MSLEDGYARLDPRIPRAQITEGTFEPRTVDDQLQEVHDRLQPPPGANGRLLQLARLLGGFLFVGEVGTDDLEIPHDLGRVPDMILLAHNLNGVNATVLGTPTSGPNATDWTRATIHVRASAAGRYAIVVI